MVSRIKNKLHKWFKRYLPAEVLGTIIALIAASIVYSQAHSYVLAAAAGWIGEGVGFFGYFITTELLVHNKRYVQYPFFKRLSRVIAAAGANLVVEFLPAEIIDNLVIRPFAMFIVPQYIHPYPLGFLIGKLSADIFFYVFAVIGYEVKTKLIER
jgi:hypothetical protein